MALLEDFERSGNWLFRWRSYLPVVGLALLLVSFREFEYAGHSERGDHIWEVVCLLISFAGLAVRGYTIGYTPEGTSGRNTAEQIAEKLNTTGAYSVVRNPLYLGNFFMWFGIVLFVHLWWLSTIFILAFWLYYERIIFAEEAFLRQRFGEVYLSWARVTPVFVPRLGQYTKPELSFSFRNVLRREYNGFFAVIAVMFVLETLGELFASGTLEFDLGWLIAVGTGAVIWLTLRTLKKKTRLLSVVGR